jgi:hypothetical protein
LRCVASGSWSRPRCLDQTVRRARSGSSDLGRFGDQLRGDSVDPRHKRLRPEARRRLREVWSAPTRAAETLYRDWDDFTTFYDFPAEHWLHLGTSNAIESVFSGVRLRTNVAKRARVRENALYLVFKIVERLGRHWRVLNGGVTLMTLVLAGERFVDGILVRQPPREEVRAA